MSYHNCKFHVDKTEQTDDLHSFQTYSIIMSGVKFNPYQNKFLYACKNDLYIITAEETCIEQN